MWDTCAWDFGGIVVVVSLRRGPRDEVGRWLVFNADPARGVRRPDAAGAWLGVRIALAFGCPGVEVDGAAARARASLIFEGSNQSGLRAEDSCGARGEGMLFGHVWSLLADTPNNSRGDGNQTKKK
jgi:hypothetical protein